MGLIHWWSLNNSIEDKGTNNKNLIPEGNPTFIEGGKTTRYSARYDSASDDHYIDNDIANCDELSIACWVKLDSSQNGWGQIFTINDWGTAWTNNKMGFVNQKDSKVYLNISDGSNSTNYAIVSNSSIQDGTWHHLVGTYKSNGSGSIIRFFVDGIEQNSSPYNLSFKPSFSSAKYICLGRDDTEWIIGNINDARIYDHCLSNVEIKNLSRALVLHYNFEELYKPLEYLESSGTQYINPGVGFVNGSSFAYELKCQYPTTTTTTGSGHHRAAISCTNGQLKVGYTQTSASALDWHTAKVSWNSGNVGDTLTQTNYLDGVQVGTYSTQPYDSNPYLLFACCSWTDNTGIPPYSYEKMRIASCKIYRNNTLVRDFIPSLRNIDGKVGLYDKVNGTFYTNAGTGDFYYEGCFEPVNYQNASISKNTVTFSKSSDGWGNSGILGKTNFDKGFVSATVAQNNRYIMIGMASVNNSYNYTQGYFIYPSNNGHYHIYEMGNHIGDMGTYAANDRFHVVYDGSKISYYINATLVREVGVSGKMYMNITNYNAASATIKDVCYGSLDFVKDNSGNELDGFPYNCSVNTETKTGEYSLDTTTSNGYIKLPNICLDTSFTITGWVKHLHHSTWARIFDFGTAEGGADYGIGLATSDTGGTICVFGRAGAGASLPDSYVTTWATNTWYHFAVVVNGTNIKFYVNGSEIYSFTASSVIGGRLYKYNYIAKSNWSADGYSRKIMSDFKIYNTSLSASDIKDLCETRMIIDNKGNIYCEKLIDNQSSCEFPNNEGLIKAAGFMVSNEAQINGEYDLLEYIEATGTQWIQTNLLSSDFSSKIIKCEIGIMPTSGSGARAYSTWIGCQNNLQYLLRSDYGKLCTYAGGNINYPITMVDNTMYDMSFTADYNNNVINMVINGTNYNYTGTSWGSNTTGIMLFASHAGGTPWDTELGLGRLYYCRFYDNNNLIRDYIPVRRKSDGVIGLFDKVDGILHTNKGSGTFGAGTSKGTCYLVGGKNIYENMGASVNPIITNKFTPGGELAYGMEW